MSLSDPSKTPYVYACYYKRDAEAVKPILNYLEYRSFRLEYQKDFSSDEANVAGTQQKIEHCHSFMAFISANANNARDFRNMINYALSIKKEVLLIYLEDTPLAKGMALQLCNLFSLRRSGYPNAVSFQAAIASIRSIQCCRKNYDPNAKQSEFVSVTPQTPQSVLSRPTPPPTAEISQADRNYAKERFEKARTGDAQAQYDLGYCYDRGEGVVQNHEKAMYWFLKAAQQGHDEACYELALLYNYGEGVEQDYAKAVYWYEKAAQQGHAGAQNNLGNRYLLGEGVPEDEEKALYWFTLSAEQGDEVGQYNTGRCYRNGYGTKEDIEKAIFWYTKAAENDYDPAQYKLACIYEDQKDMEKYIFWLKKAAENENDDALNALGVCYSRGEGVSKDLNRAFELYLQAAELGNTYAQHNVACYYKNGWGTEQSDEKMLYWHAKAAENGDEDSSYKLGQYFEETRHDNESALAWYLRAKEQGHKKADQAISRLQNPGT